MRGEPFLARMNETAHALRYLETLHARGKVIVTVEYPNQV